VSDERLLGEHAARISATEQDIAYMVNRLDRLADDVAELRRLASFGNGAINVFLKTGAFVAAILAGAAWVIDHIVNWMRVH
jgi:hypothetical protein